MQSACAVLPSVACHALQYFSTLSHKRHDFRGKKLLNVKCVFWLLVQLVFWLLVQLVFWLLVQIVFWLLVQPVFWLLVQLVFWLLVQIVFWLLVQLVFWLLVQFLSAAPVVSLTRIQRSVTVNVHISVLTSSTSDYCQRLMKLEFSQQIFGKSSWKRVHWDPSYCMRTDGRTDMTKIIVAFLYSRFRASWLCINKIQQDATVCRYLFTASFLHMFRALSRASSGVQKPVTVASGTGHSNGATTFLRGLILLGFWCCPPPQRGGGGNGHCDCLQAGWPVATGISVVTIASGPALGPSLPPWSFLSDEAAARGSWSRPVAIWCHSEYVIWSFALVTRTSPWCAGYTQSWPDSRFNLRKGSRLSGWHSWFMDLCGRCGVETLAPEKWCPDWGFVFLLLGCFLRLFMFGFDHFLRFLFVKFVLWYWARKLVLV